MTQSQYDVVIVGAGITGSILARHLVEAGKSVVVLEAGLDKGLEENDFDSYVRQYQSAFQKTPSSPYPKNKNAPSPSILEIKRPPYTEGYFVQKGMHPYASTYLRAVGGTVLHWLGTCLRMTKDDFKLNSKYGVGVDWPIEHQDFIKYYEKAEWEIGVAANAQEQRNDGHLGGPKDYEYPMERVPPSFLDGKLGERLNKLGEDNSFQWGTAKKELKVVSTPAGRNSIPRTEITDPRYRQDGKHDYRPVGAVGNPYTLGQRCVGNSSCVPICPAQAKYSALKTLSFAQQSTKGKFELIPQAVVYNINIDKGNGRVTEIQYKKYFDSTQPDYIEKSISGKFYVIAAHVIETAKLLLASNIANSSGLVGCNLMDHPSLITWGLFKKPIGSYRGPGSTSGITALRTGDFRKEFAACRVEIGNWGWSWPERTPSSTLRVALEKGEFGKTLRKHINDVGRRQFRLAFEFEQLPERANRVTIDPRYKDQLGNYRPVIDYRVSEYCQKGMENGLKLSKDLFKRIGVEDRTRFDDPSVAEYLEDIKVKYDGPGHAAGTHRMGSTRATSVVNTDQKTWDHENLYLVGCGNMPTIGTSNPTLTAAALAFKAVDAILKKLP